MAKHVAGFRMVCCSLLLLVFLRSASAEGAAPQLLMDTRPDDVEWPGNLLFGATLYHDKIWFLATSSTGGGGALYWSDGTPETTQLFCEIPADDNYWPSRSSYAVTTLNDELIVAAGRIGGLWTSDGSIEGSHIIGYNSGIDGGVYSTGNLLYISQQGYTANGDLTVAVGSADDLHELYQPDFYSGLQVLGLLGTSLIFLANTRTDTPEIWVTSGIRASTVKLGPLTGGETSAIVNSSTERALYFLAWGGSTKSFWRSDGTAAGTVELETQEVINPEYNTSISLSTSDAAFFQFRLSGVYPYVYRILFAQDATTSVTAVRAAGSTALDTGGMAIVGSQLYFVSGGELWTANGKDAEAIAIADIMDIGEPSVLSSVGDYVILRNKNYDLWSFNTNSYQIEFLGARIFSNNYGDLSQRFSVGNELLFCGNGEAGSSVWITDGTAENTRSLNAGRIHKHGSAAHLDLLARTSTNLYFAGPVHYKAQYLGPFYSKAAPTRTEIWKSNGTVEGTGLDDIAGPVVDIDYTFPSGPRNSKALLITETYLSSRLYSFEPGTPQSTLRLRMQIQAENGELTPFSVDAYSDEAVFATAYTEINGTDVDVGVSQAGPDDALATNSYPNNGYEEVVGRNRLLFTRVDAGDGTYTRRLVAVDGATGTDTVLHEFWDTEGTLSATRRLAHLMYPDKGTPARIRLIATDGTHDGTHEVTTIPGRIYSRLRRTWNDLVFFPVISSEPALWVSDGTSEGTQPLIDMKGAYAYETTFDPTDAGMLIYIAQDDTIEVWFSDGTALGTWHVTGWNLNARDTISTPVAYDGRIYFVRHSLALGDEIWALNLSDHTFGLFEDLAPGPQSGVTAVRGAVNGKLIFTSEYVPEVGNDLYAIPTPPLFSTASDRTLRLNMANKMIDAFSVQDRDEDHALEPEETRTLLSSLELSFLGDFDINGDQRLDVKEINAFRPPAPPVTACGAVRGDSDSKPLPSAIGDIAMAAGLLGLLFVASGRRKALVRQGEL